jgi:hypothetical protein
MDLVYKFHLQVKPSIEQIFIYDAADRTFLGEMVCIDPDSTSYKTFNGTVPHKYKGKKLLLQLMGLGGERDYSFNETFSKPINDEKIAKMFADATQEYKQNNFIVTNVPEQIQAVVVETPKYLQEKLKISKYIPLLPVKKPEGNAVDALSRGFDPDPTCRSFGRDVVVTIPRGFREELLKEQYFKIRCYDLLVVKEMTFS